jgi:ATP-dependent Clp protease adaptor protein ClpS
MPDYEYEEKVATKSEEKLKQPPLYKVVIHNDDFTTMEFVVMVLQQVFQHGEADAFRIMWQVHNQGAGVAGIYVHEIAETKAEKGISLARAHEYPLLFTVEEA